VVATAVLLYLTSYTKELDLFTLVLFVVDVAAYFMLSNTKEEEDLLPTSDPSSIIASHFPFTGTNDAL